jgi:hypothetical protein
LDTKITDKEIESTAELIEKLKPIAELVKLQRDIAVNRMETMTANLQMSRLKNPPKPEASAEADKK